MCHFFTKSPTDGSWGLSFKRGETFLDKAENTCLIKFYSNWYSDLYQKWQYIGIFHPLRIFWYLKPRGQSIRFCTVGHSRGTPTRNLHFLCVLFAHCYLFLKWYHCTSFKLDLLFVSYKLCLLRFYCQILSRWTMWYFSNTTSCVYWIIYADYSFRATKRLLKLHSTINFGVRFGAWHLEFQHLHPDVLN